MTHYTSRIDRYPFIEFPCMRVVLTLGFLLLTTVAFAQQSSSSSAETGRTLTKSGYDTGGSLEGGDSVTEDLARDDVAVGSVLRFPRFERFFQPWFDGKRRLNEKYGLKLQFSYQALYQEADQSLTGVEEAAGGPGSVPGYLDLSRARYEKSRFVVIPG